MPLMQPDELEVYLSSNQVSDDYQWEVTLRIIAYLPSDSHDYDNTLIFYCDPVGSNYRSSFLEVTFEDWSKVVQIRDFLADCFADDTISRQSMTVEIAEGVSVITPEGKPPNENHELREITIDVEGDRVEFLRSGTLYPYIFTYEEQIQGEAQDRNNAEKLLNFLDKTISLHPEFDPAASESEQPAITSIFDQHRVENLLTNVVDTDSSLFTDFQKSVRELEDGEYADCVRDIGRAAERLMDLLYSGVPEEDDPEKMGGRINRLDKSSDGVPSFIGKCISPLWWLRNEVVHPNSYEVDEEDALFALNCFQMAAEKLIDEHLKS